MFVDHQGGYPKDSEDHLKIFIGADHRGYRLKNKIRELLKKEGYPIEDMGTHQDEVPCDYPQISYQVASRVAAAKGSRGILVCMTGIGNAIVANKVPGVYAALCYNRKAALLSREHNNANVLILGSRFVSAKEMLGIVRTWLKTPFAGGRHLRRFKQIQAIEMKMCD